jgi:hypothetical protein
MPGQAASSDLRAFHFSLPRAQRFSLAKEPEAAHEPTGDSESRSRSDSLSFQVGGVARNGLVLSPNNNSRAARMRERQRVVMPATENSHRVIPARSKRF